MSSILPASDLPDPSGRNPRQTGNEELIIDAEITPSGEPGPEKPEESFALIRPPARFGTLSPALREAFRDTFRGQDTGLIIAKVVDDSSLMGALAQVFPFRSEDSPLAAAELAWSDLESGEPSEAQRAAKKLVTAFKYLLLKSAGDPEAEKASMASLGLMANLIMEKASQSARYGVLFEALESLLDLVDPRLKDAVKHLRGDDEQLAVSKFDFLFDRLVQSADASLREDRQQPGQNALFGVLLFRLVAATLENLPPESKLSVTIFNRFATQFEAEIEQVKLSRTRPNNMALVALIDRAGLASEKFFRTALNKVTGASALQRPARRGDVRPPAGISTDDAETILSAACWIPRLDLFYDLAAFVRQEDLPPDVRLALLSAMKFGLRAQDQTGEAGAVELARRVEVCVEEGFALLAASENPNHKSNVYRKILSPLAEPACAWLAADQGKRFGELGSAEHGRVLDLLVLPNIQEAPALAEPGFLFYMHELRRGAPGLLGGVLTERLLTAERLQALNPDDRTMVRDRCVHEITAVFNLPAAERYERILKSFGQDGIRAVLVQATSPSGRQHRAQLLELAAKLIQQTPPSSDQNEIELTTRTMQDTVVPELLRLTAVRRKQVFEVKRHSRAIADLRGQIRVAQGQIDQLEPEVRMITSDATYSKILREVRELALGKSNHERTAAALAGSEILKAKKAQESADMMGRRMKALGETRIPALDGRAFFECHAVVRRQEKLKETIPNLELQIVDVERKLADISQVLETQLPELRTRLRTLVAVIASPNLPVKVAQSIVDQIGGTELYETMVRFAICCRFKVTEAKRAAFENDLAVLMRQYCAHTALAGDVEEVLTQCCELARAGHFLPLSPSRSPLLNVIWEAGLARELERARGFLPVADEDGMHRPLTGWQRGANDRAVDLVREVWSQLPVEQRDTLGRILRGTIRRFAMHYHPERQLTISAYTAFAALGAYVGAADLKREEDDRDRRKMLTAYHSLAVTLFASAQRVPEHQIRNPILPALERLEAVIGDGVYLNLPESQDAAAHRVSLKLVVRQAREALQQRIQPNIVDDSGSQRPVRPGLTFHFSSQGGVAPLDYQKLAALEDGRKPDETQRRRI